LSAPGLGCLPVPSYHSRSLETRPAVHICRAVMVPARLKPAEPRDEHAPLQGAATPRSEEDALTAILKTGAAPIRTCWRPSSGATIVASNCRRTSRASPASRPLPRLRCANPSLKSAPTQRTYRGNQVNQINQTRRWIVEIDPTSPNTWSVPGWATQGGFPLPGHQGSTLWSRGGGAQRRAAAPHQRDPRPG
jgi:hypothetical protein